MAGVAKDLRIVQFANWFDQFGTFLASELAPTPRKLRTALRFTTVATIGTGLVAACHVYSEFGAYIVWLLVGAGPMMSPRRAIQFLIAEGIALAVSVVLARAFADTPWLMAPLLFALVSYGTYVGMIRKFAPGLLLIEVVCLGNFYDVVFAPGDIGWSSAGALGGSALAFGILVLFDNWLWPDPGDAILLESLSRSVAQARLRFLAAADYYVGRSGTPRPKLPPPTSDLPAHMTLLDQASAEGASQYRHAILLAAISRTARINLEVDRLVFSAREQVPHAVREMVRPELIAAARGIAEALDDFARQLRVDVPVGVDRMPPARAQARAAMDKLSARVLEVRHEYIRTAGTAEIENFAAFTDSLAVLTAHLERLLDEPPQSLPKAPSELAPLFTLSPNPDLARYSLKVGLCAVVGYAIGLTAQRPELSTILTTVLITALPTYGAAMRKMILRIVGALLGGIVSLVAIIIVSPNFDNLPSYMMTVLVVFFVSGYASLTSGRVSYAGRQIGTTFTLVFAGLSPSIEIYSPLWRIWSILLGTFVVAIATLLLWPVYAGDSLLPRLRRVIEDTLALAPGGSAAGDDEQISEVNSDTMRLLAEILQVADDAQLEGRSSMVDHNAIVEATGALRRIANRFASISTGRISVQLPPIDPAIESERGAILAPIVKQLENWLDYFKSPHCFKPAIAHAVANAYRPEDLRIPLASFGSWIEDGNYARVEKWTLDQRRTILAELQSMRRLDFLINDLNRWLARIPGAPPSARPVARLG